MSPSGKIAAVTGGGSGIGEATCVRLAADGARVAVIDLDENAAALTAKLAGGGLPVAADVRDSAQVDAALEKVEAELGPVDILGQQRRHLRRCPLRARQSARRAAAGRAGGGRGGDDRARGNGADDRRGVAPDALRPPRRHLLRDPRGGPLDGRPRPRRDRQHGLDLRDRGPRMGHPHYSAAKGGILAFTRTVAKELIQQGIRVNAIAPGFVDTQLVSGSLTEPLIGAVKMGTPQGRLGRPDEIAATIAFLCSDEASFFVGETVSPNGGFVTV
jgi:3-oxoacyl-[acyl-carrier protein] reductase